MNSYELEASEVILLEENVSCSEYKGNSHLILTSKKIVLAQEKGILKKVKEVVDIINLEDIKIYNGKVQVEHKGNAVSIQTVNENIKINFSGYKVASKFAIKIVDTLTGTTTAERGTDKVKAAINTVDDVLGIDTRATLKGVVEKGVAGTLLKGIKKNNI